MSHKTWEELKLQGSQHYKTGTTEPIDLYKSKQSFKPFALCSIIKYATRNINQQLSVRDIEKIIHYAELLIAEELEAEVVHLAVDKQQEIINRFTGIL